MDRMLSIIIPVYNTAANLEPCIASVLRQTIHRFEILIVDDGSDADCRKYIDFLAAKDPRIRVIRHPVNRGLFAARVSGMEQATGDYLTFLDSDDMLSMDYCRVMLEGAVREQADLTIGQTAEEEEFLHVKNLHDAAFSFDRLEGDELQVQFWGQEGNCFAWHTVWNKFYRKELVSCCLPYFRKLTQHLVMTEDLAFSGVFFLFAQKACFVHSGAYYYIHRKGNATDAEGMTLEKYTKCIHDLCVSFGFVQDLLQETGQPEWKKQSLARFRALYARRWKGVWDCMASGEDRKKAQEVLESFCRQTPGPERNDYFYHECKTAWDNRMEELKERVVNGPYRYISFDIFDTVLTRPFARPQDLYRLMDRQFHLLYPSNADFYDVRMHAERGCREALMHSHPDWQDVSVDEIYDYMQKAYALPAKVCAKLLQLERELECRYCGCRRAVREVYDLALAAGKKVLFISDMYLDEATVCKLLEQVGCYRYERLFLSSKDRKVKWTGDLYRLALCELEAEPSDLLHIGDNFKTDIKTAEQLGIHTCHVPRTLELFETYCTKPVKYLCTNTISRNLDECSVGFGCMQALAANKYFDQPFRPFHPQTDYNMDPYLIGYHAVGMHLAGLVKWMAAIVGRHRYRRIVFTSRDGWLPMAAYEKYRRFHPKLPQAVYMHVSRKSMLAVMLKGKADFYELPIIVEYYSPDSWMELLGFCVRDDYQEILKTVQADTGQKFSGRHSYCRFVAFFLEHLYSEEKHKKKVQEIRAYCKMLRGNDILFDMGYSGRIQGAICDAAGKKLDAMYVYGSRDLEQRRLNHTYHFEVFQLYEVLLDAPDFFREYLLSEPGPSCVDYRTTEKGVIPVFDDVYPKANEKFVIGTIQRAALEFLDDFYERFAEVGDAVAFSPQEVSLPLEGFLRFSSRTDRHIFSACYGEDQVYSARSCFNMEDFLAGQYKERKSTREVLSELDQAGVQRD